MPMIPAQFLNCAFFLYKNKESALAGENMGGTGFLVALPSPDDNLGHHYGVTNYHVAVSGGFSCVRINTSTGVEVFEFGPEDWIFEPDGDDIAVVPLDIRQPGQIAFFIGGNLLHYQEEAIQARFGPGDDVFMVGRFVDIDAQQTNVPAARFGNISTPIVPIEEPNGHVGDCYILDMHSRTGYSGSPVFIYRTPGNSLDWALTGEPIDMSRGELALLGIHCGQFPEELPIKKRLKEIDEASGEKEFEEYIQGMSGMTIVVPAWHLKALLARNDLATQRREVEEMRAKSKKQAKPLPEVASKRLPAAQVNPRHERDFTNLLRRAVRPPKQGD